ncbi:hypothetical protein HDU93_000717, partial [Gonapodya sp. JEL0774]
MAARSLPGSPDRTYPTMSSTSTTVWSNSAPRPSSSRESIANSDTTKHSGGRPANNFSSAQSGKLLEAVEANDFAAVKAAIANGGDPNARKRISLGCMVYDGSKWSTGFFGGAPKEKPVGKFLARNTGAVGESALAVAILRSNARMVHFLLENGADPNLPVEWKIIRGRAVWSIPVWQSVIESGSWDLTYRFENALNLAIGEGTARDPQGVSRIECLGSTSRELWVNQRSPVILSDPGTRSGEKPTYNTIEFTPDLEIVDLLLKYGAH